MRQDVPPKTVGYLEHGGEAFIVRHSLRHHFVYHDVYLLSSQLSAGPREQYEPRYNHSAGVDSESRGIVLASSLSY
jgi:hypothetical protein